MTDEESEDRAPTAVLVEATRPAPPTADEPSDPRPGRSGRGTVVVSSEPDVVARADRIVLPGDGAFPACRAYPFPDQHARRQEWKQS